MSPGECVHQHRQRSNRPGISQAPGPVTFLISEELQKMVNLHTEGANHRLGAVRESLRSSTEGVIHSEVLCVSLQRTD